MFIVNYIYILSKIGNKMNLFFRSAKNLILKLGVITLEIIHGLCAILLANILGNICYLSNNLKILLSHNLFKIYGSSIAILVIIVNVN